MQFVSSYRVCFVFVNISKSILYFYKYGENFVRAFAKAINAQLFAAKTAETRNNFLEHFISTKTAETRFLNGVSADYKVAGCDYGLIKNT